jgi:hypothetical protein
MVSALAPTVIGFLAISFGVGAALTFTAIAFILAAASIFLLPETAGIELT